MRIEDWRNVAESDIAPLYGAERARWIDELGWDPSPAFEMAETSRRAGRLPGFVARADAGHLLGWTFFAVRDRRLQIGGLVGAAAEAVRILLDAVLRAPEADAASEITCYVFPSSPGLHSALQRRRFTVGRFRYLQRDPAGWVGAPRRVTMRPWREDDGPAAARLLARSYVGVSTASWFAPRGRLEEWAGYVGQLLRTPGCGRFWPEASFVVDGPEEGRLRGLVLASRLLDDVGHVTQVAVDPRERRCGLGQDLVEAVLEEARAARLRTVSLLVAEDNPGAQALYHQLGFRETGHFLHARRPGLRRAVAIHPPGEAPARPSAA